MHLRILHLILTVIHYISYIIHKILLRVGKMGQDNLARGESQDGRTVRTVRTVRLKACVNA